MKKVFMASAVAALMVAAVACGNNNAKKSAEGVQESVEACSDPVKACCDSTKASCCEAQETAEGVAEAAAE